MRNRKHGDFVVISQEIWSIYESSFPPEERRDLQSQKSILKCDHYHVIPLRDDGNTVGFIAYWRLPDLVFVEHLAIKNGMRGKGYGTKAIKQLTAKYPSVVLEVEKPTTQEAKRRISFYQHLGFHLNQYSYMQPPYDAKKQPVPLLLMTYPHQVDAAEFSLIRHTLYSTVYKTNDAVL